jgi:hypothetical protein
MKRTARHLDNRGDALSIGNIAVFSALFALAFGAMFFFSAKDRPATTATGFAPVVDQVRTIPGPSTTGQGGGQ